MTITIRTQDLARAGEAWAPRGWARWIGCVWLCLGWLGTALAEPSFTARLDRETVSVGETVGFHLIFTDLGSPRVGDISMPDGLEVVGRSSGQSYEVVNGKATQKANYDFVLQPTRVGEFTIPSYRARIGGKEYQSQEATLKVVASARAAPRGDGQNEMAFLRLIQPKSTLYVGEAVPLELQLFVAGQLQCEYPTVKAEGFMIGTNAPPQEGATQLRGRDYRYVIFRMALTAMSAGATNLGPAEVNASGVIPTGRIVHDFIFSRPEMVERRFHLVSDPAPVRVLPLPTENVPASFKGTVGAYDMKVTAGPTNVAAGDPITLRVELTGEGNLGTLDMPTLDLGPEFKVYPPTLKTVVTDGLGLKGTKTFEWVVVPQNPDIRQLPAIEYAIFDPVQGKYRVLSQPAREIVVRPAGSTPPPPVLAGGDGDKRAEAAQDIANIKLRPGALGPRSKPLAVQPWFIALQGVPLAGVFAALVLRWIRLRKERNPRMVRQREVHRWVEKARGELRQLAAAGDPPQFYALVFRVLQETLGERLDLPAQAITAAVVDESLRPQGLPEEALALVGALFGRCDQARYAPAGNSADLEETLRQLDLALVALRGFRPVAPRVGSVRPALTALALLAASGSVSAETGFEQGNKAYAEGRFTAASERYEAILKEGLVSAPLYFNLGNTYYKLGQIGAAIAYYRLAAELAPRDADVFANLQMARVRANGAAPFRPPWWLAWTHHLTLDEWTVLAMALGWALAILLVVRWIRGQVSAVVDRALRWVVLLLAIPLVGTGLRVWEYAGPAPAVVVAKEVPVRYGPIEESRSAFVLADGAEVQVTDRQGDWLQVRDSLARSGWLRQGQLLVLR